jgi:hypothetical protein
MIALVGKEDYVIEAKDGWKIEVGVQGHNVSLEVSRDARNEDAGFAVVALDCGLADYLIEMLKAATVLARFGPEIRDVEILDAGKGGRECGWAENS